MVVNLQGFLSKHVIFLVHYLTNIVPFLPMYGRWIQTVGRTRSFCLLIRSSAAVSLFFMQNDFIRSLAMWRGYPFHEANSAILCSSLVKRKLLLQILCAQCTSALSQAIFLHHGAKLEMCMYCPVCVDLRYIVVPIEIRGLTISSSNAVIKISAKVGECVCLMR